MWEVTETKAPVGHIEIIVREEDEEDGHSLGWFPIDMARKTDEFATMLRRHGIYFEGGNVYDRNASITPQFLATEGRVVLELVVGSG